MAKVIDLSGRKKVKDDLHKTEKLEGLQTMIRCSSCGARCSKCGFHSESTTSVTHPASGITFRLCQTCHGEYKDLLEHLEQDKPENSPFWFNREWVRHWLAWLDYQWAFHNYMMSPEVLQVLAELENDQ